MALIPLVWIADGLIEGEVQAEGGSYRRDDEPGWFWAVIGVQAELLAYLIFSAVDVARV